MPTRREFVASTVGVGVTTAAGFAAVRSSAGDSGAAARAGGMEIVVTLHIVDGELKQRCDELTKQAMIERRAAIHDYDEERRRRTPFGASAAAAAGHDADPDHVTIVLKDSFEDVVELRCAHPFVVSWEKDPGLTAVDNTPPNPFGWKTPQASQQVSDYHAVRAVPVKNSGAAIQKFYKFTAWSEGLKLDPDTYCSP
jgi:hypothetical protein